MYIHLKTVYTYIFIQTMIPPKEEEEIDAVDIVTAMQTFERHEMKKNEIIIVCYFVIFFLFPKRRTTFSVFLARPRYDDVCGNNHHNATKEKPTIC